MIEKRKFKKIFIGDIYKKDTTKKLSDDKLIQNPPIILHKQNAILLKVCKNGYVDLDDIKNYFIYRSISDRIISEYEYCFGDLILPDVYNPLADINYFILESSLKEIEFDEELDDISYKTIKNLRKTLKNTKNNY